MAVKHYKLNGEAQGASGFTDLFVIKYSDLTATADNTAEAVVLDALALGDVVMQDVLLDITEAWAGQADLTATVSIGVVGTATALTPALTITTAGAGTAVGNNESSANQTNAHYKAAAAINVIATFTPDADSGLDEFTAGEVRIWMNISRAADRAKISA